MHSFCQMPFVNKQGALRGAPSGALSHPSHRMQSGCPRPLPCIRGKEGRGSGLCVPGADTEELWV